MIPPLHALPDTPDFFWSLSNAILSAPELAMCFSLHTLPPDHYVVHDSCFIIKVTSSEKIPLSIQAKTVILNCRSLWHHLVSFVHSIFHSQELSCSYICVGWFTFPLEWEALCVLLTAEILIAEILVPWTVSGTEKVFNKYLCMHGSWIPTLKPASSALVKAAYIKKKYGSPFPLLLLSIPFIALPYTLVIYQYSVIYFFSGPTSFKFLKSNISPK